MLVDSAMIRAIGARVGWTALQAGIGVAVPYLTDAPFWWALPIASILSVVKNIIATKFGAPDTLTFSPNSVEAGQPAAAPNETPVVTIEEFRRQQGVWRD